MTKTQAKIALVNKGWHQHMDIWWIAPDTRKAFLFPLAVIEAGIMGLNEPFEPDVYSKQTKEPIMEIKQIFPGDLRCSKCQSAKVLLNQWGICNKCWLKLKPEQRKIFDDSREVVYQQIKVYRTRAVAIIGTIIITAMATAEAMVVFFHYSR